MSTRQPVGRSINSTALVGRVHELRALASAIERVKQREGETLLLSGEAGIGKTRLIAEARRLFMVPEEQSSSPLILQGACFEVDRDYPFAPIIDLLERFLHEHPELVAPSRDPATAALDLLLESEPQTSPEKRRIARAFSSVLVDLSANHRLLVIVEDIHWADDTTLELLLHVSRLGQRQPMLFLFSYRNDEIGPGLRHMLARIDRERRANELRLSPLSRFEIDTLLRAMFEQPQPIRTDFLEMMHRLTDGNPFFIEEVVQSLIDSGDVYLADGQWARKEAHQLHVPRSVEDAVARRAQRVSPDARKALGLAAVIGRRFSFSVLRDLTGLGDEALLRFLRELIEQQLIQEESADWFGFRHALTRQAVYGGLLARERETMHRAVAESIERVEASDHHLSELSYHYEQSGDLNGAWRFGLAAGDRALSLFAPRAALEHYNRAFRAAQQMRIAPDASVFWKRGQASTTLGQYEEARADFERMLSIVRAANDQRQEWIALSDLGHMWTGRDYDQAGVYFHQALGLAREMDDRALIARSLLQIGNWQVNVERLSQAVDSLTSALKMFEAMDDARGRAEALDLLGVAADACGDLPRMKDFYDRAEALYEMLDDRQGIISTRANTAVLGGAYVMFETISLAGGVPGEEAESVGWQTLDLSREIEWRSGEAYALFTLGAHLAAHGRYELALDLGRRGIEITTEIEHNEWLSANYMVTGCVYADLLDDERAIEQLSLGVEAARESGSLWLRRVLAGRLAIALIHAGDLDRAASLLSDIEDRLPMDTMGARMIWIAQAWLQLARNDPIGALTIVERLQETARNANQDHDIPALARLRADCLAALGRDAEAERWLIAARDGASLYHAPGVLWRVNRSLGELYRRQGRLREAESTMRAARSVLGDIVDSIADPELRHAFHERVAQLIPDRIGAPGLTPREQDVAVLVAREMSNREIAEALFIGERTVETHVANILAKFDFSSRREIIALMNDRPGLRRDAERDPPG